ncbi:MAG TPA: TolC family protein, partial [Candidatus Deferrimicrobiaceae bacterium]
MIRGRLAIALLSLAVGVHEAGAATSAPPAIPAPAPAADGSPAGREWTLDQVVGIALANHPLVAASDADTRAAKSRRQQAESTYYPWITGSSGYSRAHSWSQAAQRSGTATNLSLQGSLSYIISDFGRTEAAVSRAKALVTAADDTGQLTRNDVAFGARLAYFNVLRAKRVLDVRIETGRQRQALLTQAQAFYESGLRARIDVARAEANLYQARAELAAAENDLRFARATLLERMGVDGPAEFVLAE